ncbi:MAG TPA: glycosyltransferase family A protein [Acidimicrobiales bacterium]|nr:glycosyltransferase family A protein [Acidimicrobiales bacterium]
MDEDRPATPGETRPRFSVVIPALDEERYLPDCLRSLAAQDFAGAVEVVVVDNNSTDRTAAIACSFGVVVVHEARPGVCWARQRGTEVARGEIIVSTDADTTFDPGWLTRIDRTLRREPSSVAVGGPCRFVGASPFWATVYPRVLFGSVALWRRLIGRVFYVTATNLAFRRDAWPGYNTQLTQGGDEVDLLRRLQRQGPVAFDRHNPTFTSSRRLQQGLAYNLVVTFFVYYLLAYWVNRVAGRPLLGTAPAFRRDDRPPSAASRAVRLLLASSALALGVVLFRTGLYVASLI